MITTEQRDNLAKLSQFLRAHAETLDFDMSDFRSKGVEGETIRKPQEHSCGAVGCAIGWGPAAGLKVIRSDDDWFAYASRVFGTSGCDNIWNGIFDATWADVDNTAIGAAQRIDRYLTTGELGNPFGDDEDEVDAP